MTSVEQVFKLRAFLFGLCRTPRCGYARAPVWQVDFNLVRNPISMNAIRCNY